MDTTKEQEIEMLVRFKPTANVAGDIKSQTWIVSIIGKVNGVPAARLIGTDIYGRDRCFMAKLDVLESAEN